MTRLHDLYDRGGQSPWLDNLKRSYLTSGRLAELVSSGVRGLTSNPTIMAKAIAASEDYDEEFSATLAAGQTVEEAYWDLVIADVSGALGVLRKVYDDSGGGDGFVSIEVSPRLVHDSAGTTQSARDLHERIDEPNLLVKIPATKEGLRAIEVMIGEGRSINVTLIFSLDRYREVIEAYLSGLEELLRHERDVSRVASVASFFVSRVDTEVDRRLEQIAKEDAGSPTATLALAMRGKAAVAQARLAYRAYLEMFVGPRWDALEKAGARPQRPLWASTSTKNPAYPDLGYVDTLVAHNTVNTMPEETLEHYLDHGRVEPISGADLAAAEAAFESLAECGLDMADVAAVLETEGVEAFAASFDDLLGKLQEKADALGEGALTSELLRRLEARDHTLWPDGNVAPDRLGWLDMPRRMLDKARALKSFAASIDQDTIVLLGMGGSSLGPEVLAATRDKLGGFGRRVVVCDTTDPSTIAGLPLEDAFVIVSSKSGTTLEPNVLFSYARSRVGDPSRYAVVTDPGTPLGLEAGELGIRHVFENQPDIGGRYSVLSYFGLVPAALMGYDVAELCERALDADREEAVALGEEMGRAALSGRDKTTIVVGEQTRSFGLWVEQLIAESTGKQGRGCVPVPTTEREQGEDRHLVNVSITEPGGLGSEFFRFELAVAIAGHALQIDPFDEPNVAESKANTLKVLGALPLPSLESFAPEEMMALIAAQVRPRDYVSLQAYLPFGQDDELEALRRRVRDANDEMAVTVGYGPRFLHSTGQLHKGGPNSVIAVQLVRSTPSAALSIPGEPYDFPTLINAQSIGDYESLVAHDRRVIRVELDQLAEIG